MSANALGRLCWTTADKTRWRLLDCYRSFGRCSGIPETILLGNIFPISQGRPSVGDSLPFFHVEAPLYKYCASSQCCPALKSTTLEASRQFDLL